MASKTNKQRKKIPDSVQAQILTECRRRCCLCYHYNDKLDHTLQGQIAHIDHNRTNHKPDNLAYLCMGHHDTYDTITSQSKGITKDELIGAKERLLAYLNKDEASKSDVVSLTLSLDTRLAPFSDDEREHLIKSLIPQLIDACKSASPNGNRAIYTIEASAEDAERILKDYNSKRLPESIVEVKLTRPQAHKILFSEHYPESEVVSKQMAQQCVAGHDQSMLFIGKKTVSTGFATVALFTKRFSQGGKSFTIIVVASSDEPNITRIYAALKAEHDLVGNLDSANPLQCLEAFLSRYGFAIEIPGQPSVMLLLGDVIRMPSHIITRDQVFAYLGQFATGARADHRLVGSLSYSFPPQASVHLLFCFDRKRYTRELSR